MRKKEKEVLLKINGKESIRTSGKGIENCIVELFGSNILKNMIKSNIGYLGNSGILKNSKEYIYTFFNRRYAKSQLIDRKSKSDKHKNFRSLIGTTIATVYR